MKAVFWKLAVALLAAYALLSGFAAASFLWSPSGTLGLDTGYGAVARTVAADGPAARAGIVTGDSIDLAGTPFAKRRYVSGIAAAIPIGEVVPVRFAHDGAVRDVSLTAVRAQMRRADEVSLLLECAATVLFVAIGAALIVLRPSPATWGFGFYCMAVNPTAAYPFRFESAWTALVAIGFFDVVQNLGVVGLLVFALNFPQRFAVRWRSRLERALPLVFVVLSAMTLYPDVANMVLARGAAVENRTLQIVFGLIWVTALLILADTYERGPKTDRERLRWVLIGFAVGLLVSYVGNTIAYSTLFPVVVPDWLVNVFISINVLLPLTVAHAVVRHRVLDINFVISRTLVYAAFTAGLIGIFGLFDYLFSHFLADFRLSVLAEAGITIAGAYAFNALESRTERAIETLFFRARRVAEQRLKNLTRALPQATTAATVDNVLIGEAQDALGLLSAALFRNDGNGRYARVSSVGWGADTRDVLAADDVLLLTARAGSASVALPALPWRATGIPTGLSAPIVAVAVAGPGMLRAVAVYGSHANGQDVDPSELSDLERLAAAAGIAYDELERRRLLAENEARRMEIADLAARLDEYRTHARLRGTDGDVKELGRLDY